MNIEMRWIATFALVGILTNGCGKRTVAPDEAVEVSAGDAAEIPAHENDLASIQPRTYETNADELLAMRLPAERRDQGWVRLFDGHTLYGWEIATEANFRIEEKAIVVDAGKTGLLCTSMPWKNYELSLEFQADQQTNSGVFLRTSLKPDDPATECYEVNIAGDDDPFPTGSLVKRFKAEAKSSEAKDGSSSDGPRWRRMHVTMNAGEVSVEIDGQKVCQWTDPNPLPAGRIGLQYREGRVAFRDIQLRPLGMASQIDEELSKWNQYPDMDGEFRFEDDAIVVDGGLNQLETKETYDDFVLLAVYELGADDTNTGLFFRCIPGDKMMGYECQVNDAIVDANRLQPADCGTGGIFRRQDARIVPGQGGQRNAVLLHVSGLQMASWVNGIQVSHWYDDREANENPRRGARDEAGTIMIQGHDPKTAATYHKFEISP